MPGNLQPLVNNQKIVNPDGTPTDYFIRWAQQRQIDISGAVPASRQIIAGTALNGGGDLSQDRTLNHDDSLVMPGTYGDATHVAQMVVDQQGHVQGVVEVPISGGGGAYAKIDQVRLVAPGSITFSAIPQIYDDLIVVFTLGVTTVNAATRLYLQMNGDTGNNYDWDYWNRYGNVGPTYGANAIALDEIPPQKTSGVLEGSKLGTIEIIDYRGTRNPKMVSAVSGMRYVPSGGFADDLFGSVATGLWRNSAAITDLTLTASINALDIGSVVTLYGRGS
jgi:hypothetical protein